MSNEVFANGMEVACQAADGKSVACFPDPCWSPPGPPAGPIVIPYPNTAYAKDLANASTTVFISGKPVAQKNKSYFKTSTGDELATRAFPMGVITGTIQGKAYFASWSMDVKVEGLNVCRHLDLMTHNHASTPGNTGTWLYTDQAFFSKPCRKEIARVERACGGQERAAKRNFFGNRPWHDVGKLVDWKVKHCGALMFKPKIPNTSNPEEFLGELNKQLDSLRSELADLNRVKQALAEAHDMAIEILKSKGVACQDISAQPLLIGLPQDAVGQILSR